MFIHILFILLSRLFSPHTFLRYLHTLCPANNFHVIATDRVYSLVVPTWRDLRDESQPKMIMTFIFITFRLHFQQCTNFSPTAWTTTGARNRQIIYILQRINVLIWNRSYFVAKRSGTNIKIQCATRQNHYQIVVNFKSLSIEYDIIYYFVSVNSVVGFVYPVFAFVYLFII